MDAEQIKSHPKPRRKAIIWISLAVVILIIIVASAIVLLRSTPDPIPADVRDAVPFSVYYPAKPAPGMSLKTSTIRTSGNTVFFDLTNTANNQPVEITQQPLPKNFDPQVMFEHGNIPTTISPLGTIYDLSFKTQSRYMITTPTALIFISATPKITNAQLQSIVNGLQAPK
jgi:hypothetical protein